MNAKTERCCFRSSFDVPAGARVLVVEDVVTTGGSVAEVIDLVERQAGRSPEVVSIIDRGGVKAFDVELLPLLRLEVDSWEADSCALCADEARDISGKSPALRVGLGITAGQG